MAARGRPRLGHLALVEIADAFGLAVVLAPTSLAAVVRPAEASGRRIETVHAEVAVAGSTALRGAGRLGGDGRRASRLARRARGRGRGAVAAGQNHRDDAARQVSAPHASSYNIDHGHVTAPCQPCPPRSLWLLPGLCLAGQRIAGERRLGWWRGDDGRGGDDGRRRDDGHRGDDGGRRNDGRRGRQRYRRHRRGRRAAPAERVPRVKVNLSPAGAAEAVPVGPGPAARRGTRVAPVARAERPPSPSRAPDTAPHRRGRGRTMRAPRTTTGRPTSSPATAPAASCGSGGPTRRAPRSTRRVSEGIAYGMLLAVYTNDQPTFDKLWQYAQQWLDANGLMNWYINAAGTQAARHRRRHRRRRGHGVRAGHGRRALGRPRQLEHELPRPREDARSASSGSTRSTTRATTC